MVSLNEWCERHREFYFKLKRYNETLNPYVGKDTFYKISEFIENNKQFLDGNKEAGVLLSSIGAKVCCGVTKDPLNLQKHIKWLLPSNRELVKVSLQYFRNFISNASQWFESVAGWITVMNIPLADLDLSEWELAKLLQQLEHIDLNGYNFESRNMKIFTETLLKYDLKFKTKDPIVLGTIARICVKYNALSTIIFIKNFGITDPEIRIEIARLCAKEEGKSTGLYIKNFEIMDPNVRMELARIYIKENGSAAYFKDFAIEDPADRAEIARLYVKQNSWDGACYFKNFAIEDPVVRAGIAHFYATEKGRFTARHFANFEISNIHDRLELLYQCAISDPESLFFMENFSPLPDVFTKFPRLIQILESKELEESRRQELFDEIDQLIEKLNLPENCKQTLIKTSKEVRELPPHTQNFIGLWLLASILMMYSLSPETVQWLIEQGMWRELALLRDPRLRVLLSPGLYELGIHESKSKLWEFFLSSVRGAEGQKGLMLVLIPFFALQKEGVDQKQLIAVATTLAGYQHEKNSQLRSVYHLKTMLHTLQAVASNDAFNSEIKKAAFEKIFRASDAKSLIKNFIAAKGLLQLKDLDWPTSSEDLSVIFRHSLEKIIPLQNCRESIPEKYDEIFASCRNPSGLLTYAAGLKTLNEPEVLNCLGRYVASVLDGTFKEMRYTPEKNPHLAKIVESNGSLLKMWKEDLSFPFETLTRSESAPIAFNPSEWLEMKLTDRHLGDTELTFLKKYLEKDSDKKGVFQELIALINFSRKEKEIAQLREKISDLKKMNLETVEVKKALKKLSKQVLANPELAKLNFQKTCLNFIQKGHGAEKNVLIGLLIEIDKSLKQASQTILASEFAKDVQGLIQGFEEELKFKADVKADLKILFTDNPIDLLLCGTDVSGSCQRLDGCPNLNKGLLGYLIDGKNRLLVIKEGDKIIARSILRLLWDGEQPVIYRERFYPDTIPANFQTALNTVAKKVATKLGVPLTSNDACTPYGKRLESLGGPAPYEYSDGCRGVQKGGFYTILGAQLIV